jgi:thiamine biosynthesis lipoprotein
LVGTTVVTTDAVLADAAATALLAAGLDDAPGIARSLGVEQFLLVDEQGNLHISAALAPRLTLLREAHRTTLIPT